MVKPQTRASHTARTRSGRSMLPAAITGALTANLRAERAGPGDGRVYTLTVQCTDQSHNSATATTTVQVPHDQRS